MPRACTVIAGGSGCGKTTFALKYLVAEREFNCRFLFDAESAEDAPEFGEFEHRLGLTPAETFDECEAALEDGFVIFNPHTHYPGRIEQAFSDFCAWTFEACARLPGRKSILLDEAWKYCDRLSIPESLATVVKTGRRRGLEPIFLTQEPHKLNGAILNEWTEWVCFSLDEEKALECIAPRGFDTDDVRAMPLGSFVSRHRYFRSELRGRLF